MMELKHKKPKYYTQAQTPPDFLSGFPEDILFGMLRFPSKKDQLAFGQTSKKNLQSTLEKWNTECREDTKQYEFLLCLNPRYAFCLPTCFRKNFNVIFKSLPQLIGDLKATQINSSLKTNFDCRSIHLGLYDKKTESLIGGFSSYEKGKWTIAITSKGVLPIDELYQKIVGLSPWHDQIFVLDFLVTEERTERTELIYSGRRWVQDFTWQENNTYWELSLLDGMSLGIYYGQEVGKSREDRPYNIQFRRVIDMDDFSIVPARLKTKERVGLAES